ncbi:unnamed protein product, partial [Choristocarpus tenellus]
AHPLCWYGPDGTPSQTYEPTFCDDDPSGNCCNAAEELEVQQRFNAANPTGECADLHKQVVCGVCTAFSAHLYERIGPSLGPEDGMTLTNEFCNTYVSACGSQLGLSSNYCDVHTGGDEDQFWSYPLEVDAGDFDPGFQKAFKSLPSGSLPSNPIAMHMTPDSSKWWVAGQGGEIKEFDATDPDVSSASQVMDIGSGHNLFLGFEEGLLDFAFHPEFTSNNLFYVHYNVDLGSNSQARMSRFTYNSGNSGATSGSEIILSTSIPKQTTIHSGGWCGFKPSDYANPTKSSYELFWVVGDGGPQQDLANRGQDPTNQMGAMMRILVSDDPAVTDYDIPSSNPFASSGAGLGEICAWGMRNPFKCSFDRETDELYCGEVGHTLLEEINIIECGNNYGWRRFEAGRCNDAVEDDFPEPCSAVNRSPYTFPTFQYCHPNYDSNDDSDVYTDGQDLCGNREVVGSSVIGGYVYRGTKYEDIGMVGNYIFHDFEYKSVHYLSPNGGGWTPGTMFGQNEVNKIVTFAEDNQGELYIVEWFGDIFELPCGSLCPDVEGVTPTNVDIPGAEFVGCFTDSVDNRRMTLDDTTSMAMTNEVCFTTCSALGASYFGTQYGEECFCGGASTSLDGVSNACSFACSGDSSQLCGGFEALSVYSIDSDGTAPTPVPPENTFTTVGCLTDSVSSRRFTLGETTSAFMTTQACASYCSGLGATFFGTEYGIECFCGVESASLSGTSADCDVACGGDISDTCGGFNAMNVYEFDEPGTVTTSPPIEPPIEPSIGCLTDSASSRRFTLGETSSSSMTTEVCSSFCLGLGATYFGTEWGIECFCGNAMSSLSGASTACDFECGGDASQTCGGFNAITVYVYDDTPPVSGTTPAPVTVPETTPSPVAGPVEWSVLGCLTDSASSRRFNLDDTSSESMTTATCSSFCFGVGATYFGTEWGVECFCGAAGASLSGTSSSCDFDCSGNTSETCGGFDAMSVYQFT